MINPFFFLPPPFFCKDNAGVIMSEAQAMTKSQGEGRDETAGGEDE